MYIDILYIIIILFYISFLSTLWNIVYAYWNEHAFLNNYFSIIIYKNLHLTDCFDFYTCIYMVVLFLNRVRLESRKDRFRSCNVLNYRYFIRYLFDHAE